MSEGEILDTLKRVQNGEYNARINENRIDPEMRSVADQINATLSRYQSDLERLEAEKRDAEAAQKHYEKMVRLNPLAITILGPDKSRQYINDEYLTVWRGSREELMEKKLTDFDIEVLSGADFYACFETKKLSETDMLVKWPDGVKKYLSIKSIPILDDAGRLEMAFYIYSDFTQEHEVISYLKDEVKRLAGNLNKLAAGDVEFDINVAAANEYTQEIRESFVQAAKTLAKVRDNLGAMIEDTGKLAEEAMYGNLTYRADAKKHPGEFGSLIAGVNNAIEGIVYPIHETIRVCEHYAEGNFKARFAEGLKVGGDFKKLKDALNNIGVQISAAVGEVNRAVVQMDVGTTEASKGSEEIAKAAEQVAQTSQKCADLSRQVLVQIEEIDRQLADLSAANEEIASTSQDVLERAQKAAQQGARAEKLGRDANGKMAAVEKIAHESVAEIEGLNAQMREINNIVKLITDIANQVNLLALNAAIEAARAGEHGRGFAVVAGEVRNLAGEAKKATNHIEKVIDGIQTSSEKTASAIKSANAEIAVGVESVNNAIEALTTIIAETETVAHGIGEIARATEDQANGTNNVVQRVAEGNRLTKETQGQMDDLAALAEEASASTEEIGSAVHELSEMAGHLKKTMQQFRV